MKTVVIFGATGKVGAYTAVELSKEYKVIAVGRRKDDNGFFDDYDIDYYSVDITKKSDFDKLPRKNVYAVIHAAGAMPSNMNGYHPHVYIDTELHGTLNILEYMATANIGRIVFTCNSNNSLYNLGKTPVPPDIQKEFPLNNDHSIFAICKNTAADIIEHFYFKHDIKRFILRLYNMYGYHPNPYYYVEGKKGLSATVRIIERAKRGMDIEIWGDPSKAKEAVYIYDCISIIKGALEAQHDGGVYNVGGIAPVTLEEQISAITEVFCPPNKPSKIIYCPEKPGNREFAADIKKTRRELKYTPQWDLIRLYQDLKNKMEIEYLSKLWGTFKDYEDSSISMV